MQTMRDHLVTRNYDVEVFPVLGMSEEERTVTFPLWNLSGKLVGYQVYRPDSDKKKKNDPREGRYFTRVKEQKVGVWGLESWTASNTLYVTEGVFDACKLNWATGVSVVAVAGATPSKQLKNWFWTVMQFRPVVVVCDGDATGLKLRNLGQRHFVMPEGLDLGDVSCDYARELVKEYGK